MPTAGIWLLVTLFNAEAYTVKMSVQEALEGLHEYPCEAKLAHDHGGKLHSHEWGVPLSMPPTLPISQSRIAHTHSD